MNEINALSEKSQLDATSKLLKSFTLHFCNVEQYRTATSHVADLPLVLYKRE